MSQHGVKQLLVELTQRRLSSWHLLVEEQQQLESSSAVVSSSSSNVSDTAPTAQLENKTVFGWEALVRNHFALVSGTSELRKKCDRCSHAMVVPSQQDDHDLICEGIKVKCVLDGCGEEFTRQSYDKHMQVCKMNVVRCGFCCEFIHRSDYSRHCLRHSVACDFYDWEQDTQRSLRYCRNRFSSVEETTYPSQFLEADGKLESLCLPSCGSGAQCLPVECKECRAHIPQHTDSPTHQCRAEVTPEDAASRIASLAAHLLRVSVKYWIIKPEVPSCPVVYHAFVALHARDIWATAPWFSCSEDGKISYGRGNFTPFAQHWDSMLQNLLVELLSGNSSGYGPIRSGTGTSCGGSFGKVKCVLPPELFDLVLSYCTVIDMKTEPLPVPETSGSALVIKLGEARTKAGAAFEDNCCDIPSVTARCRYGESMTGLLYKDVFVGDEAVALRGPLALRQPQARGIVRDWNDLEKLLDYTFDSELHAVPKESTVLLAQKPLTAPEQTEQLADIMFESFGVSSLCIAIDSVLGLFGQGAISGTVLCMGDGVTNVVPVYEGHSIRAAIQRQNQGMRDVRTQFGELLASQHVFTSSADRETLRSLMEWSSNKVICDERKGMFVLPDGKEIRATHDQFCSVISPLISCSANMISLGLSGTNYASLKGRSPFCDVYAIGKSSTWLGFDAMLEAALTPDVALCGHVLGRKEAAWRGGALLAALSTFNEWTLSRTEYQEVGESAVHRYAAFF